MAFIQPCFIRKNSPELRKKLEELGYEPSYPIFQYPEVFKHIAACNFFGSKYYGVSDDEVSHHGEIKDAIKNRGMIDCGTNEELFLALAALRDDTPINSFYYFKERLCKCEKLELKDLNFNTGRYYYKCRSIDNPMICFCCQEKDLHKATVEEIIEKFK